MLEICLKCYTEEYFNQVKTIDLEYRIMDNKVEIRTHKYIFTYL
jgi:hypothetical protein